MRLLGGLAQAASAPACTARRVVWRAPRVIERMGVGEACAICRTFVFRTLGGVLVL